MTEQTSWMSSSCSISERYIIGLGSAGTVLKNCTAGCTGTVLQNVLQKMLHNLKSHSENFQKTIYISYQTVRQYRWSWGLEWWWWPGAVTGGDRRHR